jgi:hypothetical protein
MDWGDIARALEAVWEGITLDRVLNCLELAVHRPKFPLDEEGIRDALDGVPLG